MKKIIPVIVLFIILGLIFLFFHLEEIRQSGFGKKVFFNNEKKGEIIVDSFESCMLAGYPVQESYPRRCALPGGEVFTEEIEEISYDIVLETPKPNSSVSNPFEIKGEAVGAWFFEAEFTAELLDSDGEVVSTTVLRADGEWMTEELVGFSGEMDAGDFSGRGELVLKSANPSGLPENQKIFSIPVQK